VLISEFPKPSDPSNPGNRILISIVVPTYNRERMLRAALESLACLSYPRDLYEVILVDDASSDGTAGTVREFMAKSPFRLIYLRQSHAGVTVARNRAIRVAQGDFLVFTDDDCTFAADWLERLLEAVDSPAVGAVGGPDPAPADSSLFARCVDFAFTSFIGTGGVRAKTGRSLAAYYPRGCNFLVARAAIERVGGFDPSLGAGEEIELGYRLRRAGYLLLYAARAPVYHRRRDTWRDFARQLFARGVTRVQLIRRHPGLLEWSYLIPPALVIAFAVGAMLSLARLLSAGLFLISVCSYLLLLGAGGFVGARGLRSGRAIIIIPPLLFLQHALYGVGFLTELIRPQYTIVGYR